MYETVTANNKPSQNHFPSPPLGQETENSRAVTPPCQQASLQLRLSIAFFCKMVPFHGVILIFVLRVLHRETL